MKEEKIIINSKCDNLPISITIFKPEVETEIKGIFQISHGMAEHKERYYNFMEFLTNRGYITIINTNDLGFFYDNKAEYIVEDLHQITGYIKEKYPNKKMILFGHSMGSMVVRKYLKKYDKDIDKLIVCGSPSNNPLSKIAVIVSKIVKCFKGERYRSKFIQKIAFGNYNKNLKKIKSTNSWVCANEEAVAKYDKDKLCGFIFTANGFENLFRLMGDIYNSKGWRLDNKEIPIFFIAGSDDPVIMNKEKWLKSQDFLKKLGYVNIVNKLYDNLRHEILNEKNRNEVYEDILKFIEI